MKYIIKVKDIEFKAKNKEEAEEIAIDVINDIYKNGEYEITEA